MSTRFIALSMVAYLAACAAGGFLVAARPLPMAARATEQQRWNTESYAHREESPFLEAARHPLSTFSIDVDTASYANVRRLLLQGNLPPKDAVRLEELLNYFRTDVPPPENGASLAALTEVGPCPWAPDHRLVRIGIAGRRLEETATPPRNLVFLVDVSGSMYERHKLPLVKSALALLVDQLREQDRISLVTYAGRSGLVLPPTPGSDREAIREALASLEAGGSTNGGEGIQLAYRVAEQARVTGINRVILATDGDFNVGVSSPGALARLIEEKRKSGVNLTVLGFGMGNLKDSMLEALADKGDGNYAYIDSLAEARKVLVEEAGGTLVTVAKDVKVQVEVNPARVASYRLLGYENRLLREEQFDDDTADAGELGAGQTITALYELVLADSVPAQGPALRYQQQRELSAAASSDELLSVKVRYQPPAGGTGRLLSRVVREGPSGLTSTSADFRFLSAVAAWGMVLRGSPHLGSADLALVRTLAREGLAADPHGHRRQFLELVEATGRLLEPDAPAAHADPGHAD